MITFGNGEGARSQEEQKVCSNPACMATEPMDARVGWHQDVTEDNETIYFCSWNCKYAD